MDETVPRLSKREVKEILAEMDRYANGLQRYIFPAGMTVQMVQPEFRTEGNFTTLRKEDWIN